MIGLCDDPGCSNCIDKPDLPMRTGAQLRNHYEVERGLANKLRAAPMAERSRMYATMYDELLAKVPDHPRLTKKTEDGPHIARALKLLRPYLKPGMTFLEFGPGSCRTSFEVCKIIGEQGLAYGVDISNQGDSAEAPANFRHLVYDGYFLPHAMTGTIDVIFSDNLIEHIHPDDIVLHFYLASRLLKPGGVYVFITPHAFDGPHDISKYFSNVAEGFHLKEWTYKELQGMLGKKWCSYYVKRQLTARIPNFMNSALESAVGLLPPSKIRKTLGRFLLPQITIAMSK